jgi:hypothetical protein
MFSIHHRTRIISRGTAVVLSAASVTGTYAAVIPVRSNFFTRRSDGAIRQLPLGLVMVLTTMSLGASV